MLISVCYCVQHKKSHVRSLMIFQGSFWKIGFFPKSMAILKKVMIQNVFRINVRRHGVEEHLILQLSNKKLRTKCLQMSYAKRYPKGRPRSQELPASIAPRTQTEDHDKGSRLVQPRNLPTSRILRCQFCIYKTIDATMKNSWLTATSWYHCVAEDSKIPKMPVFNPLQALVHPQTQKRKKRSCLDCQSPTPTSQNLPSSLIDLQIRNCRFQSSKQLMS